jgi:hypothetical protein
MSPRSTLTLFPLLSVMVSAMGTLAFLAIVLAMVQGHAERVRAGEVPVQIALEGAPPKGVPVPLECRLDGITFRQEGRPARFFPTDRLRREVAIVRDLHDRGAGQAGAALSRDQEWLFFKAVIERDVRLKDSLTLALHLIEISNLKGDAKQRTAEHYPVLLVYPDGVATYDLASYLMAATTRLPVEAEPMQSNWAVTERTSRPAGAHAVAAASQRAQP